MSMSPEERIAQLEAELAKEKSKNEKKITMVVSQKGCVQINGIRRFPIVLYKSELQKLFAMRNEIETFIETNESTLK